MNPRTKPPSRLKQATIGFSRLGTLPAGLNLRQVCGARTISRLDKEGDLTQAAALMQVYVAYLRELGHPNIIRPICYDYIPAFALVFGKLTQ